MKHIREINLNIVKALPKIGIAEIRESKIILPTWNSESSSKSLSMLNYRKRS